MWVLILNDMRSSNIENTEAVCRSAMKETLEALLQNEKVEPYRDGQWGKHFRQGGPLEWYNPPFESLSETYVWVGTIAEWEQSALEAARQRYRERILSVVEII